MCLFFLDEYRIFNIKNMDVTLDVLNNYPSFHASQSDSSMFFCPANQEEEQQQQNNSYLSRQSGEMMMNIDKKRVKKTVSFPFGKW